MFNVHFFMVNNPPWNSIHTSVIRFYCKTTKKIDNDISVDTESVSWHALSETHEKIIFNYKMESMILKQKRRYGGEFWTGEGLLEYPDQTKDISQVYSL